MKKVLLLGAVFSIGAALGFTEFTMRSGESFVDPNPRNIKSVYVNNQGAFLGKSENITLMHNISSTYKRPITWCYPSIRGFWFTNQIDVVFTVMGDASSASYGMDRSYGSIFKDPSSEDPNAWSGNFSGHTFHTNGTDLAQSSNFWVKVNTWTDIPNYKVRMEFVITNLSGVSTVLLDNKACKTISKAWDATQNVWNLGTVTDGSGGWCELRNFHFSPTGSVSQTEVFTVQQTYTASTNYQVVSLNVGSNPYVITNGVDCIIPANTRLYTQAEDPQTTVGIIYE